MKTPPETNSEFRPYFFSGLDHSLASFQAGKLASSFRNYDPQKTDSWNLKDHPIEKHRLNQTSMILGLQKLKPSPKTNGWRPKMMGLGKCISFQIKIILGTWKTSCCYFPSILPPKNQPQLPKKIVKNGTLGFPGIYVKYLVASFEVKFCPTKLNFFAPSAFWESETRLLEGRQRCRSFTRSHDF